jgi:hypothetical protein
VWLAFGYQNPEHVEEVLRIFRNSDTRLVQDLAVWLLAAACEPRLEWRFGASLAMLDQESGPSRRAYQASLGAEWHAARTMVGAAFKSELFGQDRSDLLAPSLVQLDARYALAPAWAAAASFCTGWWNDTRRGQLRSPADFGAGVSWQISHAVRLLAGAHHVRERRECPPNSELCSLIPRDQGTFLNAGLHIAFEPVQLAVAVEDNHVNSDGATTSLTLSARAAY